MAEQWVSASQALTIAGNPIYLCMRLHAGMISARARLFVLSDERSENASIPREFWSVLAHHAEDEDWARGDFSSSIEQRRADAFGVTIGLDGVLEMVPFE